MGTLIIAFLVYKKLLPGELKKRQLDTVLNLIEHLNKCSFDMYHLNYQRNSETLNVNSSYHKRSIFGYHKLCKKGEIKYDKNTKVLMVDLTLSPFQLAKFIENPLMPKSIVDQMNCFTNHTTFDFKETDYLRESNLCLFEARQENVTYSAYRKIELRKPTAKALVSHGEFVNSIDGLINSIIKWCKSNGIDELNFRTENRGRIF
ncbi:hypothetical protein [Saccharicrinis aurantiacus]|uniref:hypothetical protein n=1 Tax=Saccharicrinis aurantiacus TaxID=1849719 RepID=UPI000950135A|nr:hypothetical protein [Saccharicrinis aurantiacus]